MALLFGEVCAFQKRHAMDCNCSYVGQTVLLLRHEGECERVMHSFVTARTFSAQSCSFVPVHIMKEPCICLCLLVPSLPIFCFLVRAHIAKDPCTHLCSSGCGHAGISRGKA